MQVITSNKEIDMATPTGPRWEKFKKNFEKTEAGKTLKQSNYKSRAIKAKTKEKSMGIDVTEHAKAAMRSIPKSLRRK